MCCRQRPVARIVLLLALLGPWLALTPPARATSEVRPKLGKLAQDIKKFLDRRGENRMILGQFPPPPGHDATSAPGLEQVLGEELKKAGILLDRLANISLTGGYLEEEYPSARDPEQKLLRIKITVRLVDKRAATLLTVHETIENSEDIARLFNVTVHLPANGSLEQRNPPIQEKLKDPSVRLSGTLIASQANSPYAVELLVSPTVDSPARPRKPVVQQGQAFVAIQRGEIYEVRLHNKSDQEAAVTLTIDGLDVFTFSDVRSKKTGLPEYTHFVVAPRSTLTVRGWHKTNQKALSFLVTEYAKGAVNQAKKARGNVGVLTATFAFAWSGDNRPPGEPRTAGKDATGFGPPRDTQLRELRRNIGMARDVVAVRYTR